MEGLLQNRLIDVYDPIEFTFKKYKITGKVCHGGHIGNTVIVNPDGGLNLSLEGHMFPSLTSWSEACLREGLLEEGMRYASWKRVIHVPSQRTLQNLRSEYNVSVKAVQASRQDLFSEINRLHRKIKEMTRAPQPQEMTRGHAEAVDKLLVDSNAIEFFKKWNGTCLRDTCLPQTGGISD